MITKNPYSHTNVIKPGRMPEPINDPIHVCDPPDVIAICLDCPVDGGCYPESDECPLNKNRKRETKHKPETIARDERLLYLLTHGWRNTECICEELGVSLTALKEAKRRLREQGKIK